MENVFDVLVGRGYLKQFTHEEEMREILGKGRFIKIKIGGFPIIQQSHTSLVPILLSACE